MEKSTCNRFSPCRKPIKLSKNAELELFKVMHDFIFLYRLKMTLKNFPLIPSLSNLFHNPTLQTLSNAFEKSTNAQKSFYFVILGARRVSAKQRYGHWSSSFVSKSRLVLKKNDIFIKVFTEAFVQYCGKQFA